MKHIKLFENFDKMGESTRPNMDRVRDDMDSFIRYSNDSVVKMLYSAYLREFVDDSRHLLGKKVDQMKHIMSKHVAEMDDVDLDKFNAIARDLDEGLHENWETEITDIIKSDFRDLERDADNISKQDIDEVIQAYGRKHGEPDANYIDMFNFVGSYFGMNIQELQDMIEMGENKSPIRKQR